VNAGEIVCHSTADSCAAISTLWHDKTGEHVTKKYYSVQTKKTTDKHNQSGLRTFLLTICYSEIIECAISGKDQIGDLVRKH